MQAGRRRSFPEEPAASKPPRVVPNEELLVFVVDVLLELAYKITLHRCRDIGDGICYYHIEKESEDRPRECGHNNGSWRGYSCVGALFGEMKRGIIS